MSRSVDLVIIGLAITSSWGNGHATTYRSLVKGLARHGARVLFLERDQPWYAKHRDAASLAHCETELYHGLDELERRFGDRVRAADAVIVGSYVREGRRVCDWVLDVARGVRAFYDIDTPVTLAQLARGACEYVRADQIPAFDLMLSFTGGPILRRLEREYGARRAEALYCSVDADSYRPQRIARDVDLGYMGTYSLDRQPRLEALLNAPARSLPSRRFIVVGAQYPDSLVWPRNVRRVDHLAPAQHARFYSRQRYTLNITRDDMRRAGYSPSVRLFEAAACGAPIISDEWDGVEDVFAPGEEILIARRARDVVACLEGLSEEERARIGAAGRARVCEAHTGAHRALELLDALARASRRAPALGRDGPMPDASASKRAAASG